MCRRRSGRRGRRWRPRSDARELRGHVLDVAVDLLVRDGVGAFTTRRIAREAETSLPAVYELFGDKAGLVREISVRGFQRLRAEFDALSEHPRPRAPLYRFRTDPRRRHRHRTRADRTRPGARRCSSILLRTSQIRVGRAARSTRPQLRRAASRAPRRAGTRRRSRPNRHRPAAERAPPRRSRASAGSGSFRPAR